MKIHMHEKNQFWDFSGRMGHEIKAGEKVSLQININDVRQIATESDATDDDDPTGFDQNCEYVNYDDCMYEQLTKLMIEETEENCIVPWYPIRFSEELIGNHTVCSQEKDVNSSYWIYWNRATNQENDCNRPCKTMVLNIGGKNYENNNENYGVAIIYFSMTATQTKELYLYSFSSLIADIGGYLGMLLGFSFLDFASALEALSKKRPCQKCMASK